MDDIPKVSVIIPHFNMHDFLPFAVESVVSQTYGNIELIIVDDGSCRAIDQNQLSSEGQTGKYFDLKFFSVKHGGKSKAVNKGFRKATGAFLTILDADDQLPENSISIRMEAMRHEGADLCIGSFESHADGAVKSKRETMAFDELDNDAIIRKLLTQVISPFHQNAMLFSRELMEQVGNMDPKMLRSQDKDFAVRLLQESRHTTLIPKSVYIYNRYHRPVKVRLWNRLLGMKYKMLVISRYSSRWKKLVYLCWGALVGGAKLVHDLFWSYRG